MGHGGVKDLKRSTVGVMLLSSYFGLVRHETTIEMESKCA